MISKGIWNHLGDDWDSVLAGVHAEIHTTCAAYGLLGWHAS